VCPTANITHLLQKPVCWASFPWPKLPNSGANPFLKITLSINAPRENSIQTKKIQNTYFFADNGDPSHPAEKSS
jgi:hypothetical protein